MDKIPEFMNMGSFGVCVGLLQIFLCGLQLGKELIFDGHYGEKTAEAVSKWQEKEGIEADGNFGPESRKRAKESYGFDFEAVCLNTPGVTFFLQPDGEEKKINIIPFDCTEVFFKSLMAKIRV
ncbi:MAG: peptidoglycan-binding domain-containing protein [Candidatus Paceibacterota bacterium]